MTSAFSKRMTSIGSPLGLRFNGESVILDSDLSNPLQAAVAVKTQAFGEEQVTSGTASFLESSLGSSLLKLKTARSLTRKGIKFIIDYVEPPVDGLVVVGITRTDSEYTTTSALDV